MPGLNGTCFYYPARPGSLGLDTCLPISTLGMFSKPGLTQYPEIEICTFALS